MTTITRTYKARMRLSKAAHHRLDEVLADQCRLYNAALEHRRWAYKMGRVSISYAQQSRELTQIRADDPGIAAVHRTIQIATLRRLDRAFRAFFRRVKAGEAPGFPRFRSWRRYRTLVCDNNVQARGMVKIDQAGKRGTIRIKGLSAMGFRASQVLPQVHDLAEFRIIRTARRVEAQFVFHLEVETAVPPETPERATGLNMGVHYQVATADGTLIPGRREDGRRRIRLQRKLSRAKRGSNNRRKRAASLAKEYQLQTECRKGHAHQLSARLVKDYDFIAVENLSIQKMTRSAKGTLEDPGENVVLHALWNRSILDQAWGDLIAKIQYKAESAGVEFVKVDPRNTTQECSGCGAVVFKEPHVRVHDCPTCGLRLIKDVNSAINVLRRGLAHAAGGEQPGAEAARLLTEPGGAGLRRNPRHLADLGP